MRHTHTHTEAIYIDAHMHTKLNCIWILIRWKCVWVFLCACQFQKVIRPIWSNWMNTQRTCLHTYMNYSRIRNENERQFKTRNFQAFSSSGFLFSILVLFFFKLVCFGFQLVAQQQGLHIKSFDQLSQCTSISKRKKFFFINEFQFYSDRVGFRD